MTFALQISGGKGFNAQSARRFGSLGNVLWRHGAGADTGEELLLLLLCGVRLAVPADGRLFQADGHESRPVRHTGWHAALRRVPLGTILGLLCGSLSAGQKTAARLARLLGALHHTVELHTPRGRQLHWATQCHRLCAHLYALQAGHLSHVRAD